MFRQNDRLTFETNSPLAPCGITYILKFSLGLEDHYRDLSSTGHVQIKYVYILAIVSCYLFSILYLIHFAKVKNTKNI